MSSTGPTPTTAPAAPPAVAAPSAAVIPVKAAPAPPISQPVPATPTLTPAPVQRQNGANGADAGERPPSSGGGPAGRPAPPRPTVGPPPPKTAQVAPVIPTKAVKPPLKPAPAVSPTPSPAQPPPRVSPVPPATPELNPPRLKPPAVTLTPPSPQAPEPPAAASPSPPPPAPAPPRRAATPEPSPAPPTTPPMGVPTPGSPLRAPGSPPKPPAAIKQPRQRQKDTPPKPEVLPVRESKRARVPVTQFQSPNPELQQIMKSLKQPDGAPSPAEKKKKKPEVDDKAPVFFKGEHLAVRNAEGSFFICQTMQNIYKTSKKITIQWLGEVSDNNPKLDVYAAEYYDKTEFETILTSVEMKKEDRKRFRLPQAELDRILRLLQRSVDKEAGKLEGPDLSEDNPDGLDISMYKDEDQLKEIEKKKKKKQGKKKATPSKPKTPAAKKATPVAKKAKKTPVSTAKKSPGAPPPKRKGLQVSTVSTPGSGQKAVASAKKAAARSASKPLTKPIETKERLEEKPKGAAIPSKRKADLETAPKAKKAKVESPVPSQKPVVTTKASEASSPQPEASPKRRGRSRK